VASASRTSKTCSASAKLLVKITKIDDRGKLSLEPVLEEAADQEGRAAASEGPEAPPKAECFVARR
jgi:anti-sigma factor RsiW